MTQTLPPQDSIAGVDFDSLQRQLSGAVRRVCPGWLASEVEDLVQEAMIKLMRMEPSHLTQSYLKKTAYSVVVDEMRKRQRRPETGTEAGGEADLVKDQQSAFGDPRTTAAIEDCLQEQIPARRRAVTLHLLGHSVGEVASFLECKAKKAENLVYRGVAQLRECLMLKGVHP